MKTISEMIEVMQAYKRGELIECRASDVEDRGWAEIKDPSWDWHNLDYRVKPKKRYVPFDTAEEFLAEQYKRNTDVVIYNGKRCQAYTNYIGVLLTEEFNLKMLYFLSFVKLFVNCKFQDGTQCGKEVEL